MLNICSIDNESSWPGQEFQPGMTWGLKSSCHALVMPFGTSFPMDKSEKRPRGGLHASCPVPRCCPLLGCREMLPGLPGFSWPWKLRKTRKNKNKSSEVPPDMKQSFITQTLGKWPRHRARSSSSTEASGLCVQPNPCGREHMSKPRNAFGGGVVQEELGDPTVWVSVLVLCFIRPWANCSFKNHWLWYWYLLSQILVRMKWHVLGRVQSDQHSVDISYCYCIYLINLDQHGL